MKIDEHLYIYFEKAGYIISKKRNEIIYMQQDVANTFFLIKKGRVRVYAITSHGTEITYEVLDKGRIFGESSFIQNSTRPTTVSAVTDVELICVQLQNLFPYILESQELTLALLNSISQENNYIIHKLRKAYSYNRFEKVASFLLEQASNDQPTKGIIDHTLPYSHDEIAESVGLSRVTVTKVLNEFSKKGYIQNKYRKIKISDIEGLQSILHHSIAT